MTTAPPPAGARVGNVFELLEQILVEAAKVSEDGIDQAVGLRTILLSQRVCKAFRDTIANSSILREELYFAPPSNKRSNMGPYNPLICDQSIKMLDGNELLIVVLWPHRDCAIQLAVDGSKPISKQSRSNAQESWRKMHLERAPYVIKRVQIIKDDEVEFLTNMPKSPTLGGLFDVGFLEKRPIIQETMNVGLWEFKVVDIRSDEDKERDRQAVENRSAYGD